jgi:transcriptional regulator with XRE-family HTH domain
MASSADTPRARALGAELRQLREHAKLTTRQLGQRTGRSSSHISRWETGRLIPSETDVATVLAVLGVTGLERDRLLELAHDAADPNWIAPGVDRQLAALAEYERTARTIMEVEPQLIPGLLQTGGYARAVMVAFGATSGEADQRALVRLGRRQVLTDDPPKRLIAIIGEFALRYPLCNRGVMLEQLRELEKLSALANITIQVLPMNRPTPSALAGGWGLIEFERAKPVVHLEHYSAASTITDAKTVARYQAAADTLRETAMSPTDSLGLIADVITEWETTQ